MYPGKHVVSVAARNVDTITIIHASGGADAVVRDANQSLDDWVTNKGYSPCRLQPH